MMNLRSVGFTSGVGSLLIGAKAAGFDVVGNIEWRRYYHKKDSDGNRTFSMNFPGAFEVDSVDELTQEQLDDLQGIDLAMGHPECGNFSQLNRFRSQTQDKPGDIPLFIDLVAKIKPKYFVMDDLPRAFMGVPMSEYMKKLPEYDLFPEWISNYHYGNIQKNRKRMFMIGALKTEKFTFIPGEFEHNLTTKDIIGDLLGEEGKFDNHDVHTVDAISSRATHMGEREYRPTWAEVQQYFKAQPEGKIFQYVGPDKINNRPGFRKGHWNAHAGVLSGQNPDVHPITNLPFSIRERARIQGFPDDFKFYGTVYEEDGTWNTERNTAMIKQTGKSMPIQFATYISNLVMLNIHNKGAIPDTGVNTNPVTKEEFHVTNKRFLKPDDYIQDAKEFYCCEEGFDNQDAACEFCHQPGCDASKQMKLFTKEEL